MTEEEKKAIEWFEKEIEQFKKVQETADREIDDKNWFRKLWCELQNDIDKRTTILNLIQNLQEENKKKDKMIDLMADKLVQDTEWFYSEFDNYTKEDFRQYFEKKVSDGDE